MARPPAMISGAAITVQVRGQSIFAGHAAVVDGVPLEYERIRTRLRVEHEDARPVRARRARLVRVALADDQLVVSVAVQVGRPDGVTPLQRLGDHLSRPESGTPAEIQSRRSLA